jgi:hypothetical protein
VAVLSNVRLFAFVDFVDNIALVECCLLAVGETVRTVVKNVCTGGIETVFTGVGLFGFVESFENMEVNVECVNIVVGETVRAVEIIECAGGTVAVLAGKGICVVSVETKEVCVDCFILAVVATAPVFGTSAVGGTATVIFLVCNDVLVLVICVDDEVEANVEGMRPVEIDDRDASGFVVGHVTVPVDVRVLVLDVLVCKVCAEPKVVVLVDGP